MVEKQASNQEKQEVKLRKESEDLQVRVEVVE